MTPDPLSLVCRDVKVTESSESVLAGTKRPPFKLVVRAVPVHGEAVPNIKPAVSEEFVVRFSWDLRQCVLCLGFRFRSRLLCSGKCLAYG